MVIELLAHERDGKAIPSGHFRRGEPGEAPYRRVLQPAVFRVFLETPEEPPEFARGGDEHVWDAAERNGIRLPSTYRQGRCLTCAGTSTSGTVDQADAYFALRIRTHQGWQMRQHRIAHGLPAPYG